MSQDLVASQSPQQATMSPGSLAVPPATSPLQQPLNLLISKPGNKRRNSTVSFPEDTLCPSGSLGLGPKGTRTGVPEKCWDLGGSLRKPTGSTQSTHPCWNKLLFIMSP